jgi:hypothetical protein
MKKTKAAISFGLEIIEDTDTGELSLQCLCGQMALYPRRVVLTPDETARFNAGSFDAEALMRAICREGPEVVDRVVPAFPISEVE